MNTFKDGFDAIHRKIGNGGTNPVSFASIFMDNTPKKTVQLSKLSNEESIEGADVAIPLAVVDDAKYGLERVMLHNGFFFFQFSTREGMEQVLENGPCLNRLVPTILNTWMPNTKLKKDEITAAPVWVKLHNVPIVAYSKVGLTLIEVSSKKALMESLVMAIPFQNRSGHSMETIKIEYEWQPSRCDTCKIFDHIDDQCPKKVKVVVPTQESDDGFVEVTHHKEAASQSNAFSALEEDNGNPMDDLVDETRKKVEVPPKKTLRLTGPPPPPPPDGAGSSSRHRHRCESSM
ncbi:zinc knuckle CX2CX4HX4C containing protein [Tanacetum coccineum]|uniref:Zinc knuckle CX2CX4HX4C containing protein n=1 Tax=Tanacetum coccineum TaxID=301880 RepID=A0ABQ5BFR4_9ASTR